MVSHVRSDMCSGRGQEQDRFNPAEAVGGASF